jgi:hypothetical protein
MARDFAARGVSAALLWLDTDRAGSTKFATTIVWPAEPQPVSIRLIPQRLADRESRFVSVEHDQLLRVFSRLRNQLNRALAGEARAEARKRLERFAASVGGPRPQTLAQTNRSIGEFLLRERLGFSPPSTTISQLASLDSFRRPLRDALASGDEFTTVFNEAVGRLQSSEVDPQVHALAEDYLPLRISCSTCGARRTLAREREGGAAFAVARCSCGAPLRFRLGDGALGLGELEGTELWSVDVSLPLYLNDMASGIVAGKSSALYGLVLNEVLERVLGRRAIPMVVPSELAGADSSAAADGTLLYEFLVGGG